MGRTIFKTSKKESFRSRVFRLFFNFFPVYRRTGARVTFVSEDASEIHIRLKLKWTTRNYVGTVFGGSIYAAADPIYMLQLIRLLGDNYVVWDKAASIKFIKPVRSTIYSRFIITEDILNDVKEKVVVGNRCVIDIPARWEDAEGIVYAEIIKTLYIADKEYYKNRKQAPKP